MEDETIKAAAATLGRKGGLAKSEAKTIAVRQNARKRWDTFRQRRAAGEAEQPTHTQTRRKTTANASSPVWNEVDFWREYVKTVRPDAVPLYETFVGCGARFQDAAAHALVKSGQTWDHNSVLRETERRLKSQATSD